MSDQIRNLLVIGGLIGASYFAFTKFISEALPIKTVRKLAQEIKHQILIVTINFSVGAKQHLDKVKAHKPEKAEDLVSHFRTKMIDIYHQKENLILDKYGISKQKYSASLEKYSKDEKLKKIQSQILDMMEKSIHGEIPDLTVDKRAVGAFTMEEMAKIYEDMSKMILVSLVSKLQQEQKNNPGFDVSSDAQFKKAVRDLNIYDKKIEFFKARGFKEEWGCPNETFFKNNEALKQKYPEYKQKMERVEQIYERIVDESAKDPSSINLQKLNDYFIQKLPEPKVEEQVHHQENLVSHEKQTKSQPANEEEELLKEETNQEAEKARQILRAKSLIDQVPVQEQAEPIKIDDVPDDAHEFQNQLHPEQKEQVKQEQNQLADSNASLDAEPLQSEPLEAEKKEDDHEHLGFKKE